MDQPEAVTALVVLNGGKIVGRTRLQKSVYLLESCGVDLGFEFDYHHYGPYSEELSIASSDAVTLGLMNIEWKSAYGNEYAIYTASANPDRKIEERASGVLSVLAKYDAVTLELAATADFLLKNGFPSNAWEETARRKASKITPARLENSKALLRELSDLTSH